MNSINIPPFFYVPIRSVTTLQGVQPDFRSFVTFRYVLCQQSSIFRKLFYLFIRSVTFSVNSPTNTNSDVCFPYAPTRSVQPSRAFWCKNIVLCRTVWQYRKQIQVFYGHRHICVHTLQKTRGQNKARCPEKVWRSQMQCVWGVQNLRDFAGKAVLLRWLETF